MYIGKKATLYNFIIILLSTLSIFIMSSHPGLEYLDARPDLLQKLTLDDSWSQPTGHMD